MAPSILRAAGPFQELGIDEAGLAAVLAEVDLATITVSADGKENNRLVASGLAVLLGPFGAHRLYLGTTAKVAIIYGVTFGGFGVLALIDLGHLLFSKDLDAYRRSDRVFMWGGKKVPVTPP